MVRLQYLGEARGWPQTVKPRGVITDIAGFKKETYFWLRSWWLSNIDKKDAGRPPLAVDTTVFIVDTWRMGLKADGTAMNSTRNIHVYSDAPYVSIQLNGKEVVPKTKMPVRPPWLVSASRSACLSICVPVCVPLASPVLEAMKHPSICFAFPHG